jgi:hypothetical protein
VVVRGNTEISVMLTRVKPKTLLPVVALALAALGLPASVAADRWAPGPGTTWQIQFAGSLNLSVAADAFDLDMFDTTPSTVTTLHADGRHVVCYIDAGSWENWRPDAAQYPGSVKGRALAGWPGERWLDIRRIDVLGPILASRMDQCQAKGFDGVEFDNVDGYSNRTGFPLTASDQLTFDRWLATQAHDRDLAVGLKNTLDLADQLEADFDFSILEQCYQYRECSLVQPFIADHKSVIDIEYKLSRGQFCAQAAKLGIAAMRKRLDLAAWRRACP